jgi:hypothetical protein
MDSLLNFIIDLLKRHKLFRTVALVLSAATFLVSAWIYLGSHFRPDWFYERYRIAPDLASEPLIVIVAISAVVLGLCLLSSARMSFTEISGVEVELRPIRKEREEIRQRIEHDPAANVLNTIQLGLNQITEYYTINKSQARKSFSFSVFAVVSGLATLIGGVWLFYFGKTPNVGLAALSGVGGLLLQFIGGASFYIYNKSLAQLNYFYDKLVRMQDTMLSIQLSNQLEDKSRQNVIRERLILEILTRHGDGLTPDAQPPLVQQKLGRRFKRTATNPKGNEKEAGTPAP